MSASTIEQELTDLLNQEQKGKKYLHYVKIERPFKPALCGNKPPKGGWWNDQMIEAEAAVDSWEICPACKVKYSALRPGR